jgi:hypothetical protein
MTRIPTRLNNLSAVALVAGCLGIGVVVPLLLGAGSEDSAHTADHRQTIRSMSAAERRALEENYEEFRALSEAEREQYRRLHADLEQDPALKTVLGEYSTWLRTLSPWQRQELQSETDWSKRLELVRRIRDEQRNALESRRNEDRGRRPSLRAMAWPAILRGFPKLEPRDLAAVMKVIHESLPQTPELDQQVQSAGKSASVRYVRILTAAIRHALEQSGSSESSLDWPDRPLRNRLLEAISDQDDKRRLDEFRQTNELLRQSDPDGSRLLLAMIMHGIDSLWWEQAWQVELSQDDIRRTLVTLEPATQADIQSKPKLFRDRHIKWHYVVDQRRTFWRQEAQGLVEQFERMLPPPPPGTGFGPRPGFGRPGPGPRPDGREFRDRNESRDGEARGSGAGRDEGRAPAEGRR